LKIEILQRRIPEMRIGHGYDVHRFAEGRKCIIGGVDIPHHVGLLGHSDADVLLHAIMDSVLGALALGDIGHLFPDTDDSYKGADSLTLCSRVTEIMKEKGYVIAIASNSYQAQQERRTKLAGLDKYIDYYFTSMDMGVEKPSVEFFNRCFERLGNPSKDEMIMIGDSLTADVAGGKGAGIATIWFDKFKTHAENEADYAVTSLLDIKNIL
jgi:2-C-methyl-D-erythritol 2,4-cyclodiphosphate synthase